MFGTVIDDTDLCNITGIVRGSDTYVKWKTAALDASSTATLERNLRKMEALCKYAADTSLSATIADSICKAKDLSDVSRVAVFALHVAYRESALPEAIELRMEIVSILKVAGCVYDSPLIRESGVLGLYEREGPFMLDLIQNRPDTLVTDL
jgi:hypothetical protein